MTTGCTCGWEVPPGVLPTRCGRADDPAWAGIDHVVTRQLPAGTRWPAGREGHPSVRYRTLLGAWGLARAAGWDDAAFTDLVERLDAAVAVVEGHGLTTTPVAAADGLGAAVGLGPGRLLVKDETGGVAGSHKARHLFGLLLAVEVAGVPADTPLAIASCGNAALAAAVLARAAGRPLVVFVPPWADPAVVERLTELGARLEVCPRRPGDRPGDPCHHRFRERVAAGAVPFSCQGPDAGLAVDGGRLIAYEVVDELGGAVDDVWVQVGGGALASGVAQGFADAVALGRLDRLPRQHAVQTAGCAPLPRAYEQVARVPGGDDDRLGAAARHRGRYMWPWEHEPTSAATGILDDETYDWWAVVAGMVRSGGRPEVVDEATVEGARELVRAHTDVRADATGTAGLAGLVAALAAGRADPAARHLVLLTGRDRGAR